ncbi:hypothetical protein ANCCEY_06264 [Ancylostoma ceylanicum]|uniref:Protein kinase domain-containing protein n=1 Tax=Ancylostoma ceylanicum TaxID=53326 RepID=A0A0D6LRV9_9BILA|nr:hypothetical protein ANCCEY_06264 [Ancylostoma ceylanicum]
MQKPSVAGLQMICSQVEAWDNYMPKKVKEMALRAVTTFVSEGSLAAEEDMLRLYKILAKHSRKMGATVVFEKLDETGRFKNSLKFHLLWAETYAKDGDSTNFSKVFHIAKSRLPHLSTYDFEAGFRDIADQYLPSCDIFNDEEETMAVFNVRKSVDPKAKKTPPTLSTASTQPSSKSPFISGSSFTEKAYSDMKAMFSDTVVISKGNLPGITDETTLPVAPPAVEAFEVYVDEDMSQRVVNPKDTENRQQQSNFLRHSVDRVPLQPLSVQGAAGDAKEEKEEALDRFDMHMQGDVMKPKKQLVIEDEETLAGAKFTTLGIDKKLERGIVTSTPAHPLSHPPTHEDFFAPLNHELEEQMKKEQNEEEMYAQSTFMRRRSLAPSNLVVVAAKPSALKPRTVQAAERSMEIALDKMKIGDSQQAEPESESGADGDHDKTGVGLVDEAVTSAVNPWDRELRFEILKRCRKPCYQHDFDTPCPRVMAGKTVNFGGEAFNILELVGQGGFAKVYKCTNEEGKTLALKYEIPSCPWEIYICSEVKMRIDRSKQFVLDSVMEVTEAYVFTNASVLFNEYHPHGTLLDLSNKWVDPSWYIVALIGIQIAKVLRELHAAKIIHGDIKPDNFMILGKLSDCRDNVDEILSTPILRLIDWGRAIDMRVLAGQTFTGRAGTDKFDCSEMLDGRPWTYQTDYFGYVGTMHVLIQNKYAEVVKQGGIYKLAGAMKRRLVVREVLEVIFQEFLNIPDCCHMPSWDKAIHALEGQFRKRFMPIEWRQAIARFNSLI